MLDLPEQWNASSPLYSICYIHEQTVYILLGKVEDNQLTITLNLVVSDCICRYLNSIESFSLDLYCVGFGINLQASEAKPTKLVLHLNELVHATRGDLSTLIPRQDYVLERLRVELLPPSVPVFSKIPRQAVCSVPQRYTQKG